MSSNSEITVLVSVFREEFELVVATLESIAGQSLLPDVIILIDDSGDRERSIALKNVCKKVLGDLTFIYLENEENIGLARSLNKGLDKVKTKYFARIDCGDRMYKSRLYEQNAFMEKNSDVDLVGCQVTELEKKGSISSFSVDVRKTRLLSYFATAVAHPTYFGRTDTVGSLKYPNVRYAQDFGFLSIARSKGYQFTSLNAPLTEYSNTAKINKAYKRKQTACLGFLALRLDRSPIALRMFNNAIWYQQNSFYISIFSLIGIASKSMYRVLKYVINR